MLQLLFVMRGSFIPRIAPHITFFTVYAIGVVVAVSRLEFPLGSDGLAPFTLLGVTLSIYLGFRNNASYDRWWEGRKLWGQLVYDVRNLARAAIGLLPADRREARALLMESLAFCHLLRGQLRNTPVAAVARGFIGADLNAVLGSVNPADAVIRLMGQRIATLRRAGAVDAIGYRILDERLATMASMQVGCERIAGTPLPFAYTLLLHRSAYLFCLLLPFGLAGSTGWYTPLFTALVVYSFFGLDALSEELEDPFGLAPNNLALDNLSRVCEISVFEALGDVPPPLLDADR